jgi:transcriptional regulator with XRE-family HTH domain
MSATFANICVRSGDQTAVAAAVRRLPKRLSAFVAPPVGKWVMVFDEVSDTPDEDRLSSYTVMLSGKLNTVVVGFMVYESDLLLYTLAENGDLLDQYSSWPDYFDETLPDSEIEALQGDPRALARLAHVTPSQVAHILEGEHDFAEEKLAELVQLLGLPPSISHWGYNDVRDTEAEQPDGRDAFIEITPSFALSDTES